MTILLKNEKERIVGLDATSILLQYTVLYVPIHKINKI